MVKLEGLTLWGFAPNSIKKRNFPALSIEQQVNAEPKGKEKPRPSQGGTRKNSCIFTKNPSRCSTPLYGSDTFSSTAKTRGASGKRPEKVSRQTRSPRRSSLALYTVCRYSKERYRFSQGKCSQATQPHGTNAGRAISRDTTFYDSRGSHEHPFCY